MAEKYSRSLENIKEKTKIFLTMAKVLIFFLIIPVPEKFQRKL